jgi:DMSO reductase anchor subunit
VAVLGQAVGWATCVAGVAALWFMHRIYRIPARPFWNHWQVLTSFFGSMLALGALSVMLVDSALTLAAGAAFRGVPAYLAWPLLTGLALEGIGLYFHARHLRRAGGEGAAAHYQQTTTFGLSYRARNAALGVAAVAVALLTLSGSGGATGLTLWLLTAVVIVAASVIGRMLFYALVIPTTMPGAFFWRNRAFEEHARATGLAAMPQVGVALHGH